MYASAKSTAHTSPSILFSRRWEFCVVDIAALSHAGAKSTHPAYVVKLKLTIVHKQEQLATGDKQWVLLLNKPT
jgi:hypothetical protein